MNVKIMDRAGMVFTFQDVVTVHTINASNTGEVWVTDSEATTLTRNKHGVKWEMMRMTENKRRKEKPEDGE